MINLTLANLDRLSSPAELIASFGKALAGKTFADFDVPPRIVVQAGNAKLFCMPAADQQYFAIKLLTLTEAAEPPGHMLLQGSVFLMDAVHGAQLASIDAAALTAHRTGALGAFGLAKLAPSDLDILGVVGSGVQAVYQTIYAAAVRPIRNVHCLARSLVSFERYRAQVVNYLPDLKIHRAQTAETLLDKVQAVITATSSATPVLPDDEGRLRGKTFIGIGSYRPDMRELPQTAYRVADIVLIDSPDAPSEAGELIDALSAGFLRSDSLRPFMAPVPLVGSTRIFKSVGWGAYDLLAAAHYARPAAAESEGIAHIDLA